MQRERAPPPDADAESFQLSMTSCGKARVAISTGKRLRLQQRARLHGVLRLRTSGSGLLLRRNQDMCHPKPLLLGLANVSDDAAASDANENA